MCTANLNASSNPPPSYVLHHLLVVLLRKHSAGAGVDIWREVADATLHVPAPPLYLILRRCAAAGLATKYKTNYQTEIVCSLGRAAKNAFTNNVII